MCHIPQGLGQNHDDDATHPNINDYPMMALLATFDRSRNEDVVNKTTAAHY